MHKLRKCSGVAAGLISLFLLACPQFEGSQAQAQTHAGKKKAEHLAYVARVREGLARIPSLRDLQTLQPLDYPAVRVKVNRACERLRSKRTIIHACFAKAVIWDSSQRRGRCFVRNAGSYG